MSCRGSPNFLREQDHARGAWGAEDNQACFRLAYNERMPKIRILVGDVRERIKDVADNSVHCVVTSPPYWGLRDYGTATWKGGTDPKCDHVKKVAGHRTHTGDIRRRPPHCDGVDGSTLNSRRGKLETEQQAYASQVVQYSGTCKKCGAVREDKQIGLEPTPELYVASIVGVCREVRRILHPSGTLWLNLGDCFAAGGNAMQLRKKGQKARPPKKAPAGLKPKDLVGIPWAVAFALRADGWYLRRDIIWDKPNGMPDSTDDRPSSSHEYVFMLTKSPRYFFDMEAVREPALWAGDKRAGRGRFTYDAKRQGNTGTGQQAFVSINPAGKFLRSVWHIATQPEAIAHFALMPRDLAERCIKAGTSEKGVCPKCAEPWVRVLRNVNPMAKTVGRHTTQAKTNVKEGRLSLQKPEMRDEWLANWQTVEWRPNCRCFGKLVKDEHKDAKKGGMVFVTKKPKAFAKKGQPIPAIVFDPFGGAGTTALVASRLLRNSIITELSEKNGRMAKKRIEGLANTVTLDLLPSATALAHWREASFHITDAEIEASRKAKA